jgi:nitrogen fixation NifU-like protein
MNDPADLKALYRRTVLEHSRDPHHFGALEHADRSATGHNPLCGDKCTVYLATSEDGHTDISFEGAGCAICMASASIMTDMVQGQAPNNLEKHAESILRAFDTRTEAGGAATLDGEMAALGGVRDFPSRIRCATLPWKTLQAALRGTDSTVTTEKDD